jgi:hypothetical protein
VIGNPVPFTEVGSQSGIVPFLGMVRRGEYESLRERGLPLGVLVDTDSKHRLADVSRFDLVERFDFSRPIEELVDAARDPEESGIACLFNVIEFYVAQAADVAATLGIPSVSLASARLCLDKGAMRRRFRERIGPGAAARFHNANSEEDLLDHAGQLGYSVFLQPSDVSASMWSTRNDGPEALLSNYRAMRDEVPRYYERLGQKTKQLSVVVAEYLEGSNTSIDCLIDGAGRAFATPVVDVLTGRDVGIDDFHHFARLVPSRLEEDAREELGRLAAEGVAALDVASCSAHTEFIGERLGEIAARPGGNRPRILELGFGIDLLRAYYWILRGHDPDLSHAHQRAAAIVTPFPARDGTPREIRYLDRIVGLPGYLYHEVRSQPGQAVGLSKSGHRAPLCIELMSADAEVVRRGVDRIASWPDLYVVD